MAVQRADVVEAELLEQRAAGHHAAGVLLGLLGRLGERPRHEARELLGDVAEGQVGLRGDHPRQIVVHRAGGGRDRHVVVVQDHDQAGVHGAGVVHRLVGHAGAHRAIADHRDHVEVVAGEIARGRHAERRRDRGRAVGGAERVVAALGPLGEAGQAARLAQRADPRAPPGQDLVRVGLVADVPDQLVARRVEHVVQRHRQLDHAEPGAEMAAGDRHRIDRLGAQLVRQLAQALRRQATQRGRLVDRVEQRGLNHGARSPPAEAGPISPERRSPAVASTLVDRLMTNSNTSRNTPAHRARAGRGADWRSRCSSASRARAPSMPSRPTTVALPAAWLAPEVLAGQRGIAGDVEQIVLDLEGEAEIGGIGAQDRTRRLAGASPRIAPASQANSSSAPVLRRCSSSTCASPRGPGPRPRGRSSGRRTCQPRPAAPRELAEQGAAHRRLGVGRRRRARISKARHWSASPARIAVASSNWRWQLGRPRRVSASSIAGRSSWTSE